MNKTFKPVSTQLNDLSKVCVNCIYKVHKTLGPGLLESVYEACLFHDLSKSGVTVLRQVILPIHYDGVELDEGYRIDLLVNRQLIIEIKAVTEMHPIYLAQILTYLRLSKLRLGLLVNFNSTLIKDGMQRVLNPQAS